MKPDSHHSRSDDSNRTDDSRSDDVSRAGSFLRLRWHQWLTRAPGVKATPLPLMERRTQADEAVSRLSSGEPRADTGKTGNTGKNDSVTIRNAQNCTFEVF